MLFEKRLFLMLKQNMVKTFLKKITKVSKRNIFCILFYTVFKIVLCFNFDFYNQLYRIKNNVIVILFYSKNVSTGKCIIILVITDDITRAITYNFI